MIARLKLWAVAIGFAVAALVASWLGGRKAARADDNEAKLDAVAAAKEVENEVEALDRDALMSRAQRWVRGPER